MIYVEQIRLAPHTKALNVGDTYYIATAEVCPTNATCKSLHWRSEDTSIAVVSKTTGHIRAIAPGTVRIYADATDGSGVSNYFNIVVKQPVTSITLSSSNASIYIGATTTLIATITPSNATNKSINWTSLNESIATVNNGVVTGVSSGSTTVVATAADGNGAVASCNIVVNAPNATTLNASSSCLAFIIDYEGTEFLPTARDDGYGNLTIGYGHVVKSGESFGTITEAEALELFAQDIASTETMVRNYTNQRNQTWSQQEYDAFVSLAYNAGTNVASVMDDIIGGMDPYDAFSQICHSNGEFSLGLYRRRMDEADIFVYGEYQREYRDIP